ncbi:MAG: hydrogenase maturation nickel metallochaperone HypA [Firmicutes bacterium]|nr:hydrogenase maturation nickel metallochaperone HypA [Bacillota bacterium]
MHEMSLMAQLFSIVQAYIDNYSLKKVTRVVLRVGEMSCVTDSALEFAFQVFARGSKVEGAELVLNKAEAVSKCTFCGRKYKINYTDKICPECKQFNYDLISGDELLLERLEGE